MTTSRRHLYCTTVANSSAWITCWKSARYDPRGAPVNSPCSHPETPRRRDSRIGKRGRGRANLSEQAELPRNPPVFAEAPRNDPSAPREYLPVLYVVVSLIHARR